MLLAIKKAEIEIDKHIAEGEQALREEKEAIKLWLAAREKEYLNCQQQFSRYGKKLFSLVLTNY